MISKVLPRPAVLENYNIRTPEFLAIHTNQYGSWPMAIRQVVVF